MEIILDQQSNSAVNQFSIALPFSYDLNPNLLKYLSQNSFTVKAFPSFILYDNTLRQIKYFDFSASQIDFGLYLFQPSFESLSFNLLSPAQTQALDDTISGNEVASYIYLSMAGKTGETNN